MQLWMVTLVSTTSAHAANCVYRALSRLFNTSSFYHACIPTGDLSHTGVTYPLINKIKAYGFKGFIGDLAHVLAKDLENERAGAWP